MELNEMKFMIKLFIIIGMKIISFLRIAFVSCFFCFFVKNFGREQIEKE